MGRLSGKVAAITGGASGIGEATSPPVLLKEGARVAFADRDRERGVRIAAGLQASGAEVLFVEAQMQRETDATAFIQQAEAHFGHLHILVNNAGIRMYQPRDGSQRSQLGHHAWGEPQGLRVCAKAAIPVMQRAGGGTRCECGLHPFGSGWQRHRSAVRYHQGRSCRSDALHGTRSCGRRYSRQCRGAGSHLDTFSRTASRRIWPSQLAAFLEVTWPRDYVSNGPVPAGSRTLHFVSCLRTMPRLSPVRCCLLTAGIRRCKDWWPSVLVTALSPCLSCL